MAPPGKGFQSFTPLAQGGNSYLYTPPSGAGTRSATSGLAPDLIILCAWMGALPKHILKYTAAYQKTYPRATILVITNDVFDVFSFRSNSVQQKRVTLAVEFIHSYHKENPHALTLLHSFSNGGALQGVQLGRVYYRKYGQPLPVSAMALDSAPGAAHFQQGMNATLLAIPRSIRLIVTPLVFTLMCFFWALINIFRMKNVLEETREALLDKSLWPKTLPRVYVYSKTDELVGFRDVETHAAEAKRAGWPTELVEVVGSAHVTHMQKDTTKYWDTISGVLQRAQTA